MKIETKSKFHDYSTKWNSTKFPFCVHHVYTRYCVVSKMIEHKPRQQDTLIIREEIDWFVSFVYSILAPAVATVTRGVIRQQQ